MKNLKEIKTTIIGLLALLIAIDYEFTRWVINVTPTNHLYFVGCVVVGFGFLFMPDDIIGAIRSIIKKKTP